MVKTIESTFDDGTNGWSTTGGYTVTWVSQGGDPGGYIQDTPDDFDRFVLDAPPHFLGDKSDFRHGSLTIDVRGDVRAVSILFYGNDGQYASGSAKLVGLNASGWSEYRIRFNHKDFDTYHKDHNDPSVGRVLQEVGRFYIEGNTTTENPVCFDNIKMQTHHNSSAHAHERGPLSTLLDGLPHLLALDHGHSAIA